VYRNDGGGSFSDISAGLPGVDDSAVAWGDYDNDGDLDILLTGRDSSNSPLSRIYRNDGGGSFSDISAGLPGVDNSAVTWGDYDNDGDLDILLTGAVNFRTTLSRVYRNEDCPADLSLTKTVEPVAALPGEAITYTLTFSNAGTGIATGVVITDVIPVSVTNVSVVSSGVSIIDTGASPAYVWEVQDLAPTEGGVITITADISSPLAAGVFTNTATIATTAVDSDTTNNSDSAGVTVLGPEMAVIGAGQVIPNGDTTPKTTDDTDYGSVTLGGTPITHTFTISNSGAGDLTLTGNPTVALTTGTHFSVTSQPGSSTLGSNSTTTFDITFSPTAGGSFTDTVTIANNDPDENPYTFVISGTGVDSTYDLDVNKTAAATIVGDSQDNTTTITYTVSVHNLSSNTPATGVVVSDTLPLAVTFVTSSTTNGSSYNNATGVWDVGTVNAGSGVTLTVVVEGNNLIGQTIINTAVLSSSVPAVSNPGTRSASVSVTPSIYYFPLIFKDSAPD
jgi:uncharacterized repeat protein (TIGR01451 family)